jgi:hypothetical protein
LSWDIFAVADKAQRGHARTQPAPRISSPPASGLASSPWLSHSHSPASSPRSRPANASHRSASASWSTTSPSSHLPPRVPASTAASSLPAPPLVPLRPRPPRRRRRRRRSKWDRGRGSSRRTSRGTTRPMTCARCSRSTAPS